MNKSKTVVVGLSGGVDSSICAYFLKKEGYKVIAIFMRNWDSIANNDILGNDKAKIFTTCPEEQDWIDAQLIANKLDIPIYREDFIQEYWDNVFENLIAEYKAGRTPNPDILCNKHIKFGSFLKIAKEKYNADMVATGHYANVNNGILSRGIDNSKDQSYFLAQVNRNCLLNILFPIGNMKKVDVRILAKKLDFVTANKKDSTGICFIGERKFAKFLENYIPSQPGDIISIVTNKKIGEHNGVMYYTIGQRKGLNLGGLKEPHYVAGHNVFKKIIYAAPQSHPEYLISDMCLITNINIISPQYIKKTGLTAKFRYRQKDIPIKIFNKNGDTFVQYKAGCRSVTPGQQCVLYYKNLCIGGGVIDKIYKNHKRISYL